MIAARRWIPWLAGALAAALSGGAVLHLEAAERARLRQEERLWTLDHLSAVRARLEGSLNALLLLPRGLAAAYAINPEITKRDMELLAAELMASRGHLLHLTVSRRFVVEFVYPPVGNEKTVGLDYLASDEQRAAVMRAVGTRQPVVAGPVALDLGGSALVGRIPVFETLPDGPPGAGRFLGLVSAPIDLEGVLSDAGLFDPDLPIRVGIRGRDGLGAFGDVFFGGADLFNGPAVKLDVSLPGGRWQLAALAKRTSASDGLLTIRMLGGLVSLLLGVLAAAGSRYLLGQRAARDDLRTLLTGAPFAILAARLGDGQVVFLNDRAASVLAPVNCGMGSSITQLLSAEAWSYLTAATRASGGVHGVELPLPRADNTPFWVLLSAGRLAFDGAPVICLALADISRAKQAEEELKQTVDALSRSNAELERFAYVASHDLQEPLRTVISYAQFLERRYGPQLEGDAREFLDFIVGGARRMHSLVNDLLAYSRVGSQGRAFARIASGELVASVMNAMRETIRASGGEVVVEGDLPEVRGDTIQLVQLFQNLIGNALKFQAEGRPARVRVGAERKGDQWLFHVRDNGIGIELQYLPVIFDVFKRLHTADAYPGTGIGLSICKRVVERHGGRIWAESTSGEGTTFWFTLPAVKDELTVTAEEDTAPSGEESFRRLPLSVDIQLQG